MLVVALAVAVEDLVQVAVILILMSPIYIQDRVRF
jgi:hypothetical protein